MMKQGAPCIWLVEVSVANRPFRPMRYFGQDKMGKQEAIRIADQYNMTMRPDNYYRAAKYQRVSDD